MWGYNAAKGLISRDIATHIYEGVITKNTPKKGIAQTDPNYFLYLWQTEMLREESRSMKKTKRSQLQFIGTPGII